MKKTIILGLAVAGMAISSINLCAASSEKYPASSFEPTVIYIDKDAVEPSSGQASTAEFDAKYPAANFQPTVVYIDKDLVEQEEDKFDPKYPAAYFKPNVIYP
ncbi:MAG: hypothetical protein ACXWTS_08805 [Methylococcaceae bacterium]